MRPLTCLAVGVAALAPVATAWPTWLDGLDSFLARRQDAETPTPKPTETPAPSAPSSSVDRTRPIRTNLNTAVAPTGTDKDSAPTGSKTTRPKPTEFDQGDAVGSVVMVTPAPLGGVVNLYRIGDYVTFGWNYTNVQAEPSAVNVLVSCSKASETWTITTNMTFASAQAITWDTKAQATDVEAPLLTEEYTLIVYDAASEVTATPVPGYLSTFSTFKFGMYIPRAPVPLNEWECPTCTNGAPGGIDRSAVGFAVTMSFVAVISFTWFVTGLGVL